MKICKDCEIKLPKTNFYKNKANKDGLGSYCQSCSKIRNNNAPNRYTGVTKEQRDVILKSQNYKCAICKTSNPRGKWNKFHLDHCHETGRIRGYLCDKCNRGLGLFNDNIESLHNAISYLLGFQDDDVI